MKIGTVAGTNDSTTTIATNDMVQEHVTNFTKELFGYIANGIGDDISSIARTMLGEVLEKVDDWQIERFQQSIQDDKISFTIQTDYSENIVCYRACVLIFYVGITIISLL
ncbi:protein [Escherichia coli]|nr:protein [Escherichia coli]